MCTAWILDRMILRVWQIAKGGCQPRSRRPSPRSALPPPASSARSARSAVPTPRCSISRAAAVIRLPATPSTSPPSCAGADRTLRLVIEAWQWHRHPCLPAQALVRGRSRAIYRAWWGWKNVGATLAVALDQPVAPAARLAYRALLPSLDQTVALNQPVIFHLPSLCQPPGSTFFVNRWLAASNPVTCLTQLTRNISQIDAIDDHPHTRDSDQLTLQQVLHLVCRHLAIQIDDIVLDQRVNILRSFELPGCLQLLNTRVDSI